MVKNLSQLKKAMRFGTRFKITAHARPQCIGEIRMVHRVNTTGFYSVDPINIGNSVNKANFGLGSWLGWSKAPFWVFSDDTCALYHTQEHDPKDIIIAFTIINDREASR